VALGDIALEAGAGDEQEQVGSALEEISEPASSSWAREGA
jgi:hypothetical protein